MKKTLTFLFVASLLTLTSARLHAADQDGDTVADELDNCPMVANSDQKDKNFNHVGDVCESDWDGDGVSDSTDKCWDMKDADQADLDGDSVGDLCDIDMDGDGYTNTFETATLGTDPKKWDTDGDNVSDFYDCGKTDPEIGFAADCSSLQVIDAPGSFPNNIDPDISDPNADDDGDGILNGADNCPTVFNPGQQDKDSDGRGDACDNVTDVVYQPLFAMGGGGPGGGCSVISEGLNDSRIGVSILILSMMMLPVFILLRKRFH